MLDDNNLVIPFENILCRYIPYKIQVEYFNNITQQNSIQLLSGVNFICNKMFFILDNGEIVNIQDRMLKPLLRTLDDVKDEELKELLTESQSTDEGFIQQYIDYMKENLLDLCKSNMEIEFYGGHKMIRLIEWSYKHHIDIFGLIDNNMAIKSII